MARAPERTWQQGVGEVLRSARDKKRLADVAFEVRIIMERDGYAPKDCPSGDVIGRYERGDTKGIPIHHALALAELFDLDVRELIPSSQTEWTDDVSPDLGMVGVPALVSA